MAGDQGNCARAGSVFKKGFQIAMSPSYNDYNGLINRKLGNRKLGSTKRWDARVGDVKAALQPETEVYSRNPSPSTTI